MSHHISTNGENDSSDQFLMCFDISPLKDFDEEDCLLENLRPFSSNKRKVLLHPVMTTFVMMKYNSLALGKLSNYVDVSLRMQVEYFSWKTTSHKDHTSRLLFSLICMWPSMKITLLAFSKIPNII